MVLLWTKERRRKIGRHTVERRHTQTDRAGNQQRQMLNTGLLPVLVTDADEAVEEELSTSHGADIYVIVDI